MAGISIGMENRELQKLIGPLLKVGACFDEMELLESKKE
jgi:hypothetical protein